MKIKDKNKEPNEVKTPEEVKTDQKDRTIKELTETLQRIQADFENYKKRVDKEKKDFIVISTQEIIADMLPVLDSIELALKNRENKEEFLKGVELIFTQVKDILAKKGLKVIPSQGKKFDHTLHEVLMKEKKDEIEDEVIIEELQRGYMLGNKVLRHSKVKINKK